MPLQISDRVRALGAQAQDALSEQFARIDAIAEYNTQKVLSAFQTHKVAESMFQGTTGYGYDDLGRETLGAIYADLFGAEDAMVRINFVNGTHAISSALYGVLRPGDVLVSAIGAPYDTLQGVIGITGDGNGSLKEFGITYRQVDLTPENTLNCRAFRGRFMGGVYDFIAPPGFAEILLTFWKGGRMDKNQGYEIIQAVMLENGRGFALGHNPAAPSPYVTWACYDDKDGQRQYEWGHYGSDRAALEQDFAARVQEYQRLYNVDVRQVEAPGLYKYYSTQRPVDIGTFPKPPRNAPDEIVNYDQRVPVENGSFLAWGHLTYTRPLTKRQVSDYELRPAPDNPDRPRSIREQMKTAAKQAEADRGQAAPKKNAPDRGDR